MKFVTTVAHIVGRFAAPVIAGTFVTVAVAQTPEPRESQMQEGLRDAQVELEFIASEVSGSAARRLNDEMDKDLDAAEKVVGGWAGLALRGPGKEVGRQTMTVASGTQAKADATGKALKIGSASFPEGLTAQVSPTLAADGKHVRLELFARLIRPGVSKSVQMNDIKTVAEIPVDRPALVGRWDAPENTVYLLARVRTGASRPPSPKFAHPSMAVRVLYSFFEIRNDKERESLLREGESPSRTLTEKVRRAGRWIKGGMMTVNSRTEAECRARVLPEGDGAARPLSLGSGMVIGLALNPPPSGTATCTASFQYDADDQGSPVRHGWLVRSQRSGLAPGEAILSGSSNYVALVRLMFQADEPK